MFNIGEISAVLGRWGVARTHSFAVNITPPAAMYDSFVNDLPLLVSNADLPGVDLQVDEFKHLGYGLSEMRPIHVRLNAAAINVIGDSTGKVLEFFNKWVLFVANYTDNTMQGVGSQLFNYPDEYYGTIEIYLYDSTAKKYVSYRLDQAYPVNIGNITLGWEQTDVFMQIPVGFTYRTKWSSSFDSLQQSSASPVNTNTNGAERNIEMLSRMIPIPDVELYRQRLQTTGPTA